MTLPGGPRRARSVAQPRFSHVAAVRAFTSGLNVVTNERRRRLRFPFENARAKIAAIESRELIREKKGKRTCSSVKFCREREKGGKTGFSLPFWRNKWLEP